MFDLVVIGAQTATVQPDGVVPALRPPIEWVLNIVTQAREAGCAVYLKPNLLGDVHDQSPGDGTATRGSPCRETPTSGERGPSSLTTAQTRSAPGPFSLPMGRSRR